MFTNSPLVSVVKLSPNMNSPRNHRIDTLTPHCVVGEFPAASILSDFARPAKQASCNYCIGMEGEVGLCVEEKNRSWCSSNAQNDHRAITIECSSGREHPFVMSNVVIDSLIKLSADCCKRNGIPKLLWRSDKTLIGRVDLQNVTVHRWFSNMRSCPGDFLYDRLYEVADEVNKLLIQDAPATDLDQPFQIRVTQPNLGVYKVPGDYNSITRTALLPSVYTIVKVQDDWGLLKSGAGWVNLNPIFRIGE